jgi:hypothetical protein
MNTNIQIIKEYLEDLISDILENKENPRFVAWKVRVLISKLEKLSKEQKLVEKLLS